MTGASETLFDEIHQRVAAVIAEEEKGAVMADDYRLHRVVELTLQCVRGLLQTSTQPNVVDGVPAWARVKMDDERL